MILAGNSTISFEEILFDAVFILNLRISEFYLGYAGVTLANLLHIFFDFYSANTRNINVTKLKMQLYKSTLFLAIQHIQFTKHYFDFESKTCMETGKDQTTHEI